jgi:hypothetical protein
VGVDIADFRLPIFDWTVPDLANQKSKIGNRQSAIT